MEEKFEFTKEELIEAFRKWNEEYQNYPESFKDELGNPQKAAKNQADILIEKLNEN